MIYVFDTNTFSVLKNYYPARFPSLWNNLNSIIGKQIHSVHEVHSELERVSNCLFLEDWVQTNKGIFYKPCAEEQLFIAEIFKVKNFQALISKKSMDLGTPVADPFIIAAAKHKCGTVVTEESHKPHAAKIPNVCEHFGIPCMNFEEFMDVQGWTF